MLRQGSRCETTVGAGRMCIRGQPPQLYRPGMERSRSGEMMEASPQQVASLGALGGRVLRTSTLQGRPVPKGASPLGRSGRAFTPALERGTKARARPGAHGGEERPDPRGRVVIGGHPATPLVRQSSSLGRTSLPPAHPLVDGHRKARRRSGNCYLGKLGDVSLRCATSRFSRTIAEPGHSQRTGYDERHLTPTELHAFSVPQTPQVIVVGSASSFR